MCRPAGSEGFGFALFLAMKFIGYFLGHFSLKLVVLSTGQTLHGRGGGGGEGGAWQ